MGKPVGKSSIGPYEGGATAIPTAGRGGRAGDNYRFGFMTNGSGHEANASRGISSGGDHLESRHPDQTGAKRETDHQTGYGKGPQDANLEVRDHPH